jgi:magnesium transporter
MSPHPNPLLLPELRAMLEAGDHTGLTEIMHEFHAARVAEFAEGLTVEETWQLLAHGDVRRQAEVFPFFSEDKELALVQGVGREKMSQLLEAMPHDDRVDLLRRCDAATLDTLMPLIAKAEREDIRGLFSYHAQSVGAVMTTDYATLGPDLLVSEAIERLRQVASHRETIYYVYVIDDQRHLIGFVSLRDLILARPTAKVRDIMKEDVISVTADQDQEHVARMLAKFDFIAIPVVDLENRIVGIVTHDDLIDVLEEEATEDFHLSAAVSPLTRGYRHTGIVNLYSRRVMWLVILVFVNLISSGVIAAYEETLQASIALAFFLPLLIDSGGNTGSQAATLVIRALATNEVRLGGWLPVLLKEIAVGAGLGLTMALASFLLGWFRGGVEVGIIVGLSMICIVMITNLIGALLPFILTRLRLDPAVASSPLITTISDATGLFLYFTIATWIMAAMGTL